MPRPAVLSCERISRSFGAAALFEGLTFSLHEGDHVGLVGPNGAGKSTLLKLLAGLETPDSGTCSRRKGIRVGYVPQSPVFPEGMSAEQVVERSFGRVSDEYERHQRVREALSRTGFVDPQVKTDVLSGGWRARLAIARELALSPDILLLDEPTNHLDIESILWLEELLRNEMMAFVAVSHDRYFLDNIANRMLEVNRLHPSGLFQSNGTYADFLEARDEQLRNQAAYQDSLAGLVRREVTWLRRGAKARTTKSKARIQSAERSIEQLEQSRARSVVRSAGIEFTASGRRTKELWGCKGLDKSFGESSIFKNLDLQLGPGTRLGVLGPNGSGKTTLLRIIVGEIEPTSGSIQRAEHLRVVYFDQHRESLDPALSLKRALAPEADSVIYRDRSLHVASWARRFLFRPEQLETPVGSLSGGERARVAMARMMLQPADLLVLDEPTNDLDIPALDVLEESLLDFPGALVLVTHDRYLIDRVSTQILALGGAEARHYADYDQWEANRRLPAQVKREKASAPAGQPQRPGSRKLTYLEQREWDGLEVAVLEAEAEAAEARRLAEDPAIVSDAGMLQRRHAELEAAQLRVNRLYARWAELEAKRN